MTVPRGLPTIIDCITDAPLLGLSVSPAQETLLRAIYGLPLSADQLDLWRACTGRATYPGRPFGEVTVLAGARAGKDSRIAAPVAVFEAVFGGHEHALSRGERGVIPVVAQDQRAARIAFGFIREYFRRSPLLAALVSEERTLELGLTNGLSITCFPCTLSSLRGWSIPAAVLDELAFWRLEGSSDSDVEIQASIRRGTLSFAAPRLAKITTPYMRSGVAYEDFHRAFGQDDPDVLVWKASSALMNPTITAARLARERRLDPVRYAREYEAEFSEDLAAFLPAGWIDGAIVEGRAALTYSPNVRYAATTDPSGGGADAWPLHVYHVEGRGAESRLVSDVLVSHRRVGAHTPDLGGVVREYADWLRRYRVSEVVGDRYAGEWVSQAFADHGIRYLPAPCDASAAHLELGAWLAQGRVALLDHPALARELRNLERRPRPGGRDLVTHPRGGHDDHAVAVALAAAVVSRGATQPALVVA